MKISNVCMNCKKEPEPFETSEGEFGYYMIIPKGEQDPIALMSNLEYNWIVCLDKSFVAKDGEFFICSECFEKQLEVDDNEDPGV